MRSAIAMPTDGRNPLPKRAGRRLDARRAPIFGVPGRPRADLPELLEVVDPQAFVAADAGQIEQARRAACSRGRPDRTNRSRSGQWGSDASNFSTSRQSTVATSAAPHRQAGMAALGLLDRVEGEKADRIGHRVVRHARRTRDMSLSPSGSPQEMGAGNFGVPSSGSGLSPRGTGASVRGGRRNLSIALARALTFRSSIA